MDAAKRIMIMSQLAEAMPEIVRRAKLPDAVAVKIKACYPEWVPGEDYKADEVVEWQGVLYRLVTDYTSVKQYTPDMDITHYTPINVDPETGYDEWQQPTGAHDAYDYGTIVKDPTDGKLYQSTYDGANVWGPPSSAPGFWQIYEGA